MNSSNSEAKNKSNEIMVKLFLENLLEKYSLKEIIDCIISETTLCYNNKHKKELSHIISLICKSTSIDNIFKYILEMEDQKNTDKEESQKRISLSTDEEEFGHQRINNIINISDDDLDNENIINITDSDDNIKENENNKDIKIIKNKDYSFSKNYNLNNKNKAKDLSYHYSIINGDCYKYKLKGINEDEGYKVKEGEGDNVNEIDLKYWKIKEVGDQIMHNRANGDPLTHAVVLVKNNRWPGTLTVWKEEKFANIYVGFGIKAIGENYFPTQLAKIDKDPGDLEEQKEPNPEKEPPKPEEKKEG